VIHGEKVVKPAPPTKNGYNFVDWLDDNGEHWVFNGFSITSDITLNALWSAPIDYNVSFINDDGELLYSTTAHYGDVISYPFETPKANDIINHYTYVFTGWNQELVVTGDMIFVAQYEKTYTPYIAIFVDENGNELCRVSVAEGEDAVYQGQLPTKASSGDIVYQFDSWKEEKTNDTFIYKPQFEGSTRGLSFENGVVTKYTGAAVNVTIPKRWDGYDIVEIGSSAFSSSTLRTVTIPDGVVTIGTAAFYNCTKLKTVALHETITCIGNSAFESCSSLELSELSKSLIQL
jgi:hypothetical protein